MDKHDSKLIITLVAKDYLAEDTWKKNMDYYMSPYDLNDDNTDLSSREATPVCQVLK